ncbi:MAG: GNAT family N-acetyltransferase [Pseudomonadota bacterium]
MRIRTAEQGDYAAVTALLQVLNPVDPPSSAAVERAYTRILDTDGLHLLVADDDGDILGTCYLNVLPNLTRSARPYAVIENVVTSAAHRNRGVGQALIADAVQRAAADNCYKVMLLSGRSDPAVHAFYRRCGFDPNEKQAYVQRLP